MLKRIKVKFPFAEDRAAQTTKVATTFHRWIQNQTFEGHLLIDVANYMHVPNSYNIILVAHEADIVLDSTDNHHGLAYVRKNTWTSDGVEGQIEEVMDYAKTFKTAFQNDLCMTFGDYLELSFLDRGLAPNTPENQRAYADVLRPILAKSGTLELLHQDPRYALGFRATSHSRAVDRMNDE